MYSPEWMFIELTKIAMSVVYFAVYLLGYSAYKLIHLGTQICGSCGRLSLMLHHDSTYLFFGSGGGGWWKGILHFELSIFEKFYEIQVKS